MIPVTTIYKRGSGSSSRENQTNLFLPSSPPSPIAARGLFPFIAVLHDIYEARRHRGVPRLLPQSQESADVSQFFLQAADLFFLLPHWDHRHPHWDHRRPLVFPSTAVTSPTASVAGIPRCLPLSPSLTFSTTSTKHATTVEFHGFSPSSKNRPTSLSFSSRQPISSFFSLFIKIPLPSSLGSSPSPGLSLHRSDLSDRLRCRNPSLPSPALSLFLPPSPLLQPLAASPPAPPPSFAADRRRPLPLPLRSPSSS